MATASPLSLALSLVFALGQLLVGAGVARWALRGQRWRQTRSFVLLLLALWFVCSGIAELFVSGMETLRQLMGWPSPSAFAHLRARADAALLVATLLLVVALLVFALIRARAKGTSLDGAASGERE